MPFDHGDVVVVFSDGVTEAMSDTGEEYCEDTIARLLAENPTEPASGLIDKLVASVRKHAGSRSQTDDITLVVIRRE